MINNYNSLWSGRDTWDKNQVGNVVGSPPTKSKSVARKSWQLLMLFAFTFMFMQLSIAQTITIGTGALTGTAGTNGDPIYRSSAASTFTFSQSVHLLTQSQLTTAGLSVAKSITSMAFYKSSVNTLAAGRSATMRIYMKSSSATGLIATQTFAQWISGATLVYNNTNVLPADLAATGAVTFPFSSPFVYSGSGGIEIAVDWSVNTGSGNPTTGSFQWTYNSTTPIQAVGTSNSAVITTALSTTQLRSYRMNLTLAPPPSCIPPTTSAATLVTDTGASINWSASPSAPSDGYQYEVRTSGAAGSGLTGLIASGSTTTAVVTAAITGLTGNTTYNTFVRANCGSGDFSNYSSGTFTTACTAISTFPYNQGFESAVVPALPSCMTSSHPLTRSTTTTGAAPRTGTIYQNIRWTPTVNKYVYSEPLAFTSGSIYNMGAWYLTDGFAGWTTVKLFVNTTQSVTGATLLATVNGAVNTTYAKIEGNYVAPTTGTYYFFIEVIHTSAPNDMSIDDMFAIQVLPCVAPPTAGTISPSNVLACVGGTPGVISLTGNSIGTGLTIQWEQSADGISSWTNAVGTGATTNDFTPTATVSTFYRAKISCSGSDVFTNVSQLSFVNCDFNVSRSTGITFNSISTSGIPLPGFTTASSLDDSTSSATNIGFNFVYKGQNFSQFSANTNGLLSLGATTSTAFTNNLATATNVIAPFWDDLAITTGTPPATIGNFIRYKLDGTSPNRVLTVEWIGLEKLSNAGGNSNFQVKLYETTNVIEIIHGQMQIYDGTSGTGSPYTYSVGLAGSSSSTGTIRTLALLGENSNVFTSADGASLASVPECNVTYTFTGALAYTGATTFADTVPSNDEAANAIVLPMLLEQPQNLCGTYYNSNLATASAQSSSCAVAPDDDVWFKFVAPTSGNVSVAVRGANGFNAVVSVTDNSFVELIGNGCVNASAASLTENLSLTGLTVGSTYYVRVSHLGTGSATKAGFSISVNEIPAPPVNDNPCGAIALTPSTTCLPYSDTTNGRSGSTNLTGATTTTVNGVTTPTNAGVGTNVTDVWFKFTATSDYHGITATPVPGFDVAVQAFGIGAGTSCPTTLTLSSLGTVNGAGIGVAENIQFSTVVGEQYYLRVFRHPTGISGAPVNDSQFSICVFNPAPICVVNTAPVNAATAVSATPTLTWPATSFAASYDVYLGTSSGPTSLLTNVLNINAATTYSYTLTPAQSLNELTQYFWYVTPKNTVGAAPCGAANQTSFTTGVIPVVISSFNPTSVCNGASNLDRTIVITGSGFIGATAVTINGVAVQSFVVNSNTSITAVVASNNTTDTVNITKPSTNGTSLATFTVKSSPVVSSIIGASNAMCTGTTMLLTNSTVGGVWSTSNALVATVSGGSVSALVAGNVVITYTVTVDGCSSFTTYAITVNQAVVINTQPVSQTIITGAPVTFSVAATGTGLSYQWEMDDNINGFTTIVGETNATFTIPATTVGMNGNLYRCVVSGASPCAPLNSNVATLTVGNTGISSQPANQSICGSGAVTFNVVGNGDIVSYQWYNADILGDIALVDAPGSISGATTDILVLSGLTTANSGENYYVVITGNANSATSNTASLTVNESATVVVNSTNNSACYSGATVNFVATATGSFTGYQWEYSSDNFATAGTPVSNGTPVGATYAGGTTANLAVTTTAATPVSGMNYYRCTVIASAPCTNVSSTGTLLNFNTPNVTVVASATSICNPGGTAVTLTASGASTYVWSPATGLSATTGSSVTANPSTTTTYIVNGTDATGCSKTAQVTILVGPNVVATATATPATVCPGVNSQLQAVTPINNLTAAAYSFAASSGTYSPLVGGTDSSAVGDDGTQNTIAIGFPFSYSGSSFTTFSISTNGTIRLGGTATSFTNGLASNINVIAPMWDDNNRDTGSISYSTTGTAPNRVLTVQWADVSIGGGGTADNSTNNYQVQLFESSNIVRFNYGTLDSTNGLTASIGISGNILGNYRSVTPLSPVASTTSSSTTENTGISAVVNIPSGTSYTFTPPTAFTYTYAWSPTTFMAPGQEVLANPLLTAVSATTTYSCVVTSNVGCSTTVNTTVTVNSGATITTEPVTATVCQTQTATLSVVASGPGLTYQWRKNGVNLATPASATTATLTLLNSTIAMNGSYDVIVTPSCGAAVTSAAVSLLVNPTPTVVAPVAQSYCVGTPTPVVSLVGTPSGVTFDITGGSSIGLANQTGVTAIPSFTSIVGSATITIAPKANGCSGTALTFVLTINPLPSAVVVSPSSATVCSNAVPLTLTASGGVLSNVYCLPTVGSTGLTGDNITNVTIGGINNTTSDGPGDYNYYSALTANIVAGVATPLSITPNSAFGQQFRVWIDMNQNGLFEAAESVFATTASTTVVTNTNITIPTTAFNGVTRMRIADKFSSSILATESCSHTGFGEFEDYNVNITGGTNNAPVWSPITGLFTNAAGTVAYAAGVKASTVYAKPSSTTTYTVTATTAAGCPSSVNVTVTVTPATTWYADADGDTYGNLAVTQLACIQPVGYVANSTDCNDANANVNPGKAEIAYNGIDDNCDGQFDEGFPAFVSELTGTTCGSTLTNNFVTVHATQVAGATGYRFRVTNLSTNSVQIIDRTPFFWFQFNTVTDLTYGTTYRVEVMLQRAGIWLGTYGAPCQVTTPSISGAPSTATSTLNPASCGTTLATINTSLSANQLSGATGYRFRITNTFDSSVQTLDRTVAWFTVNMMSSFVYGVTYTVEVAVKTTGTAYAPFGSICSFTMPAVPGIQTVCGTQMSKSYLNFGTKSMSGVTEYKFEVTNTLTTSVQTIIKPVHYFNFAELAGIVPSTAYSIRVALKTTGVYSAFSDACLVTSPAAARETYNVDGTPSAISDDFKVLAMPNPFDYAFALDMTSNTTDKVAIKIYDMIGKLIEAGDVEFLDIKNVSIGENYPSGVYNVIVNQGENVKTLRVIKR